MSGIRINSKTEIPEEQLEWSFARSSGPGGQNVNKVNTKATMRWNPDRSQFPPAVWRRFCSSAKRYFTTSGSIVIQSQEHREQKQNIEACKHRLRTLLQAAYVAPKTRVPTKPSKASNRRRLDNKRRNSDKKKLRRNSFD